MFIIDEFDEVLKAFNNQQDLDAIINGYFKSQGINPMYALFSATIDDDIQINAQNYINQPAPSLYLAIKNRLYSDNVTQFKIKMSDDMAKRKFLENLFQNTSSQA